jgi:TonB family protein
MPTFSKLPLAGYDDASTCVGKWAYPKYDKLKQRFNPRGLGSVSLRLGVNAKGEVEKVVVDQGDPTSQYVRDAVEFIQSVHFEPATCNGRRVPGLAHSSFRTTG